MLQMYKIPWKGSTRDLTASVPMQNPPAATVGFIPEVLTSVATRFCLQAKNTSQKVFIKVGRLLLVFAAAYIPLPLYYSKAF